MKRTSERAAFIAAAVVSRQRGEQLDGSPDARFPAQSVAAKWDALTQAGRKALILRDPSMRMERFSSLVERMSCSQFADLTPIQQDGVGEFWKFDSRGRYSSTQEIK